MATNALTIHDGSVAMQVFGDDYAAIRSGIAPNLTDTELDYLASVARSMGLSVLRKQIYGTKRKSKDANGNWTESLTIQVGIDGYRVIADRTGKYAGQVGPHWCGEDGRWVDVWLSKTPPAAAKVGVLRKDFKEPLWSVAIYESYVARNRDGSPSNLWARMPELMLAKCAESLALRKAFPDEMGGTYTEEEMEQANNVPPPIREIRAASLPVERPVQATVMNTPRRDPGKATAGEIQFLWTMATNCGVTKDEVRNLLAAMFPEAKGIDGSPSTRELTSAQAAQLVATIEEAEAAADDAEPETATESAPETEGNW